MSAVYFTTEQEGEARLRGSEHAWMAMLCTDLAAAIVSSHPEGLVRRLARASPLRDYLVPGQAPMLPRWVRTYLATSSEEAHFTDLGGTPLKTLPLILNTVLVLGSDPVCVMARLRGQCEIHCYVEGPDRAWLAGLIDDGRAAGVMRAGKGWEDVTALLRGRDDQPVVCYYSITDDFPNETVAGWQPPARADGEEPAGEDWDAWYELPDAEQWRLSMDGLRNLGATPQLTPGGLRSPFGHQRSFVDLFVHGPLEARAATR